MALKDRLREARKNAGLSQEQLSGMVGIAKSTLSGYERDGREPSMFTLSKLMEVLGVDANFLLQDEMKDLKQMDHLLPEESEHIKKFRCLDEHGKTVVTTVTDLEYDRCQKSTSPCRVYTYYRHIACAGEGFLFDDIPVDTIEAQECDGADFVIGVNGDSMEPTFSDGDLVYVRKASGVKIGAIGIFTLGNECFIKERGEDGLISHNPNYPMIEGCRDIRCVGEVLGKVII
jgi:transcriptional regulator with XRE-family HTH domain